MKAKVQFKILILALIASAFTTGLYSQQEDTAVSEQKYLWFNAGLGPGSFSSMSGNFGSSFGLGLNYSYNNRVYKARFVRIKEFKIFGDSPPPDSIWEAGILYGFSSVTKKSMVSFSLGISYVGSEKNIYVENESSYYYQEERSEGVGIPIEAQAVWFALNGIGMSVSLFGDFNKENSFSGLSLGIIIGGKMRRE